MPTISPISINTVDVAEAVAIDIKKPAAGTIWSQSGFHCERCWLPTFTDKELLDAIQIAVIPVTEHDDRTARNLVEREHVAKVWFQKKVDPLPADQKRQLDELVAFLFQVKDYWMTARRSLSTLANVHIAGSIVITHSPKDLDERKLWAAVLELKFRETTRQ